jgi:hypothetical protein
MWVGFGLIRYVSTTLYIIPLTLYHQRESRDSLDIIPRLFNQNYLNVNTADGIDGNPIDI